MVLAGSLGAGDGRATMDIYNGESTPSDLNLYALCMEMAIRRIR